MKEDEALSFFADMGELLRSEPDKAERQEFFQWARGTDEYQDAFQTLHQRAKLRSESGVEFQDGGKCDNCPNRINPPISLSELIDRTYGEDGETVPKELLGTTPWGAEVYELTIGDERHMIVPVRLSHVNTDYSEAQIIVARRAMETGTPSANFYPFIVGPEQQEG